MSHAPPAMGSFSSEIAALIADLDRPDGLVRQRARLALVDIGAPAVPALISRLSAANVHTRWEAAKALCDIGAPEAAPALVGRLDDRDPGIRWLAAEALIVLGPAALPALLAGLASGSGSEWLRSGAHHVLTVLRGQDEDGLLAGVLAALEGVQPTLTVPPAAKAALTQLQHPA
jgi:HEAT repeat protein